MDHPQRPGLLTDPAGHDGDPDDAFDVVIPSLPGFAFSSLPAAGPVTPPVIADLWARLMTGVLGYPRFGAYGGDIGSHVTGFLGARHRDRVLGIYTHHPNLNPVLDGARPLSAAEHDYLAARQAEHGDDSGYAAIQSRRGGLRQQSGRASLVIGQNPAYDPASRRFCPPAGAAHCRQALCVTGNLHASGVCHPRRNVRADTMKLVRLIAGRFRLPDTPAPRRPTRPHRPADCSPTSSPLGLIDEWNAA